VRSPLALAPHLPHTFGSPSSSCRCSSLPCCCARAARRVTAAACSYVVHKINSLDVQTILMQVRACVHVCECVTMPTQCFQMLDPGESGYVRLEELTKV